MDPNPANLSLPIETLATLGFYIMLLTYIIFSAIFHYHWKEYNVDNKVTRTTLVLYYSSTIPLMLILGIMAIII